MVDLDTNLHSGNISGDTRPTESSATENVFQVLANNARHRTLGELRTTVVGCSINAVFIWWRYPGLSWLAAGLAACAAYGVWGLLDRSSVEAEERGFVAHRRAETLRDIRPIVAIAGTSVALWALFRFMAAALGGWQH